MTFVNEENNEVIAEETVATEEVVAVEEATAEETVTEEVDSPATEEATEAPAPAAPAKGKPHVADPVPFEKHPENYNPFEIVRRPNPRFEGRPQVENPFEERLLDVKRVIKTTKGGRRFKFSALVVVGDKKGRVGFAIGKSIEVPDDIIGHHGAAKVLLMPAQEGKGIIASDKVRAVVELAGIRNIYSKNQGSNNPLNVVQATVEGLTRMNTKEHIMNLRGKKEL
jgi:small subunit ribosomal protein S5